MKKAYIETLGCRLNQAETELMSGNLSQIGFQINSENKNNDLYVLNTCTVTEKSDAKCRKFIRTAQRLNPQAQIAVVGCLSQVAASKIEAIGGVHYILGNQEKINIHQFLKDQPTDQAQIHLSKKTSKPFEINFNFKQQLQTRCNLKIQDGCNFHCSFCIIPFARGRSRSRNLENIISEAKNYLEKGGKEIILTGVNIGTYQYKNFQFYDILDQLDQLDFDFRVRISSIEPTTIDEKLFEYMQSNESKVVPYLHLPIQAAHDSILSAMRRRYQLQEYVEYIQLAKKTVKNICIGTDIMAGFPGETDEIFEESIDNLIEMPLDYFHVFPYSERDNTRSITMENKIPQLKIHQRTAQLRDLSMRKKSIFQKNYINKKIDVLFEKKNKSGYWEGYSENFIRIFHQSDEDLKNKIHTVEGSQYTEQGLFTNEPMYDALF